MNERSRAKLTLGDLDFRSNSIGFLRLVFAATVLWSHAFSLGGFGEDPLHRLNVTAPTTGLLAVGGFFVLSGFLITRSFETVSSVGRFIWHRFLRIFPAFWTCLVVTAFGLAPLAFAYQHGTLHHYFAEIPGPWSYVTRNFLLATYQQRIGTVFAHVPSPFDTNLSLWTLTPEFFCYLCVAALGVVGIIRRVPVGVGIVALLLFAAYAGLFWRYGNINLIELVALFVYFAFGAFAYLSRERIPIAPWIAALCFATLLATLTTRVFAYVIIPCVVYLTLFAAMRLPLRAFDRRVDVSYGLYIYAFPVQQLLAMYGVTKYGFTPYFACALAVALALAAASWFTIEKPSLSLKHLAFVPALAGDSAARRALRAPSIAGSDRPTE
jgi:peptidoglycan/LPS O-acetylase OafA/YrhL